MKVLVTGGRDYADKDKVVEVLTAIRKHRRRRKPPTLIVGDAPGLDTLARDHAELNRWRIQLFKAEWSAHGKAAGPIRNQQMVDQEPDVCIAFPGGAGTNDCTRRARAAIIPVLHVDKSTTAEGVNQFLSQACLNRTNNSLSSLKRSE